MDFLTIVQLAIKYGPLVRQLYDESVSNDDLAAKLRSLAGPIVPLLEDIGSSLFPKAAPALHVVGGVVAGFNPNLTVWLQNCLNALVVPTPNLVADGVYGPRTSAAVERLQVQLGLKVDGLAGALTQAAIQAAYAKLPVPKTA